MTGEQEGTSTHNVMWPVGGGVMKPKKLKDSFLLDSILVSVKSTEHVINEAGLYIVAEKLNMRFEVFT